MKSFDNEGEAQERHEHGVELIRATEGGRLYGDSRGGASRAAARNSMLFMEPLRKLPDIASVLSSSLSANSAQISSNGGEQRR
jgi:hypothetical protein